MVRVTINKYNSPLLFVISFACTQPWSRSIKWKTPEISSSCVLNCMLFWVADENLHHQAFHLIWDLNHLFIQHIHYMHYLVVSPWLLFYLTLRNRKRIYAGESAMSKGTCSQLKERKTYTEIAQSYGKNESSIHETGSFVKPQIAKLP